MVAVLTRIRGAGRARNSMERRFLKQRVSACAGGAPHRVLKSSSVLQIELTPLVNLLHSRSYLLVLNNNF